MLKQIKFMYLAVNIQEQVSIKTGYNEKEFHIFASNQHWTFIQKRRNINNIYYSIYVLFITKTPLEKYYYMKIIPLRYVYKNIKKGKVNFPQ